MSLLAPIENTICIHKYSQYIPFNRIEGKLLRPHLRRIRFFCRSSKSGDFLCLPIALRRLLCHHALVRCDFRQQSEGFAMAFQKPALHCIFWYTLRMTVIYLTHESTSYRSFCSHFTLSPMRFSSYSRVRCSIGLPMHIIYANAITFVCLASIREIDSQ